MTVNIATRNQASIAQGASSAAKAPTKPKVDPWIIQLGQFCSALKQPLAGSPLDPKLRALSSFIKTN